MKRARKKNAGINLWNSTIEIFLVEIFSIEIFSLEKLVVESALKYNGITHIRQFNDSFETRFSRLIIGTFPNI